MKEKLVENKKKWRKKDEKSFVVYGTGFNDSNNFTY